MKIKQYNVLLKTYAYKGHTVNQKIVMLTENRDDCFRYLKHYKKFIEKQPDPYFGKVNECHGRRMRNGLKVWVKGGKAIVLTIIKIRIAM